MSVIQNKSHFLDKTLAASKKTLNAWDKHLLYLIDKRLDKGILSVWKAENITNNYEQEPKRMSKDHLRTKKFISDWLTLSLAILVVILVGYIGFVKFAEWRRRRDYALILQ